MPVTILLFRNYSHQIGDLLFPKLCRHIRRRPTGEHVLPRLNEYRDNLLPSEFTPRAANGQRMHAIGKLSVRFQLAGNEHEEDVYIFPHLSGVIVSWRAAKALKILPPHYPLPPPKAAPVKPVSDPQQPPTPCQIWMT